MESFPPICQLFDLNNADFKNELITPWVALLENKNLYFFGQRKFDLFEKGKTPTLCMSLIHDNE